MNSTHNHALDLLNKDSLEVLTKLIKQATYLKNLKRMYMDGLQDSKIIILF
jgi:hypothetical protein